MKQNGMQYKHIFDILNSEDMQVTWEKKLVYILQKPVQLQEK